ncbi:hypothetical protein [Wenyingzhuangia sp.]|uniref:hypothetical protein n=1 Tax=Wenyingzhuangia sp. TaxID=1964193 RepID=UPI003219C43A
MKKSGGLMFKNINDSLIRIDHSYDNKLHHRSLDFVYKDEIYRLGGYGYFHFHNLMVKYNTQINEWEKVEIEGLEKQKGFSFSRGLKFLYEDRLLFFGIQTTDGYFPNKGYSIDLKSKRIINQLSLEKPFVSPNSYAIYDNRILILYYNKTSKLVFYDIRTKKIREKFLNLTLNNSIEEHIPFRIEKDKIIFKRTNINGESIPLELNIDFVLSESSDSTKNLYSEETYYLKYGYIFLLFLPLFYWFYKQKRNTFYVRNNSLYYENKIIVSDKKQIEVIKLLFEKSPRINHDLNQVFMNEGINPIHINRVKNQNVEKINSEVELKSGISNFILKEKSEIDKRMTVFRLNKKVNKQPSQKKKD